MTTFSASDVAITRHGRVPVRFVLAVMMPIVVAAAFVALGSSGAIEIVAMVTLGEAVFFLAVPEILFDNESARRERVSLRADARGLFVGERCILGRAAIASAAIERYAAGTSRVVFLRESGAAALEVWLEGARAKALIDAMALDVDHATASFLVDRAPLVSWRRSAVANAYLPIGAVAVVGALLLLVRESGEDWWLLALPPALATYRAVAQRFRPTASITIGADGIALPIGAAVRIVSHASIRAIARARTGAIVRLNDGGVLTLRIAGKNDFAASRRDALVQRLEASHAAALAADHDREGATLLMRGGRTIDAWTRDLRALVATGGHAYRSGALSAERALRIALDPTATASARAGAAFIVALAADAATMRRLRTAADATADKTMRGVLLALADPSVGACAISCALAAVDDELADVTGSAHAARR